MAAVDQGVAWAVFFGLVLVARVLTTRVAVRFLGPRLKRLVEWWMARPRPRSESEAEFDELRAVLRRQQLTSAIERLRRILATDEYMSATRQIANWIAYRGLLHDLENTPDVLPGLDDDIDCWAATVTAVQSGSYGSRRASAAETLEIGWRR